VKNGTTSSATKIESQEETVMKSTMIDRKDVNANDVNIDHFNDDS